MHAITPLVKDAEIRAICSCMYNSGGEQDTNYEACLEAWGLLQYKEIAVTVEES